MKSQLSKGVIYWNPKTVDHRVWDKYNRADTTAMPAHEGRPPPLGNVTETTIRDNIRSNISRLADYPNDSCTGCAGATCVINQAAERNLRNQVTEWLQGRGAVSPDGHAQHNE